MVGCGVLDPVSPVALVSGEGESAIAGDAPALGPSADFVAERGEPVVGEDTPALEPSADFVPEGCEPAAAGSPIVFALDEGGTGPPSSVGGEIAVEEGTSDEEGAEGGDSEVRVPSDSVVPEEGDPPGRSAVRFSPPKGGRSVPLCPDETPEAERGKTRTSEQPPTKVPVRSKAPARNTAQSRTRTELPSPKPFGQGRSFGRPSPESAAKSPCTFTSGIGVFSR
ncbi:hypothetical protein C7438_0464 [Brockia lithotrophica]|uniref:Uncharacterized protein n=1 Tax=Brockia lithotrophica TaxID=933949 RepID=A0A660L471_9BACL|nr:hypothetical protein C7438_0464 [Brockia lithotrophica]